MKKILNFIGDLTKRISSRKFFVLVLSVVLFVKYPKNFTGDHLLYVFIIFIGGNIVQKWVEGKKEKKESAE